MNRADLARDVVAGIGALSVSIGCGIAWLPLGFIVFGGLCLGVSLWGAARASA